MTDYERDYTSRLERQLTYARAEIAGLHARLTVARMVIGLCVAAIVALAVRP